MQKSTGAITAPPYEINQEDQAYNILFNMHGISESGIKLRLDSKKHSLTVYAERKKRSFTDQFLWVFSLPKNMNLKGLQTYYNNGVVQFRFPKIGSELHCAG